MVLPIRAHLDSIKRLMVGDFYIGRGSRERGLTKSVFCNTHEVSTVGRERAIELFDKDLSADQNLLDQLWTLSGPRLVCHCTPNQACQGDVLIRRFSDLQPDAFDRSSTSVTPDSAVLEYLAMLIG